MGKALKLIKRIKEAMLIPGKFPGMKNAQYWEVLPMDLGKGEIIIRCETRVAKVNLNTGKAILSDNGKTSYKDVENLKGPEILVPKDMMDRLRKTDLKNAA